MLCTGSGGGPFATRGSAEITGDGMLSGVFGSSTIFGGIEVRVFGARDVFGGMDARAFGVRDVFGGMDVRTAGAGAAFGAIDVRAFGAGAAFGAIEARERGATDFRGTGLGGGPLAAGRGGDAAFLGGDAVGSGVAAFGASERRVTCAAGRGGFAFCFASGGIERRAPAAREPGEMEGRLG